MIIVLTLELTNDTWTPANALLGFSKILQL